MGLRRIAQKLLAIAGLLALLAAGAPGLAESLTAAEVPACCNTAFCPLHHRSGQGKQAVMGDCDGRTDPARPGSSMQACDSTPDQAVGTAPFTLAAPITISYEATMQNVPLSMSQYFPFLVRIPSTPPPRTLLS